MMQTIDLNLAGRERRSAWLAPLLFAVAAAVVADAGWTYVSAKRTIRQAETIIARSRAPRTVRAAPPEEIAAARDTVRRLALPWPGLFGALESAASDDVTLLAIAPDPHAGKVTISGDSKDYLAALAYVLNLSRSDVLSHVELVRHEVKENDPRHPVAFAVSASWKEVKR